MKSNLIKLVSLVVVSSLFIPSQGLAGEFSGEATMENRLYFQQGVYGNEDESTLSVKVKPQYSHAWDQDRKVITITPYAHLNHPDNEKNHVDLREASYVGAYDDFGVTLGLSKVFWGVTESKHLVDIVNQTDSVENIDGEDKLGQPMINGTYTSDYGNFSLFVLPFFRERTFPGPEGRLRAPFVVDTDRATYSHEDEEKHIDYAFRWSHYLGNLEWGVSYFRGTDRSPILNLDPSTMTLTPFYVQSEQLGLELQYIYDDFLLKFEGLRKDREFDKAYVQTVAGFEYTYSNVFGGMDIGVLYEHLYNEKSTKADDGFYNHSFVGSRIAVNDAQGAEFLFGGFFNNEEGDLSSFRFEGSRRINNNWKWEVEANWFVDNPKSSPFDAIKKDDYMQLSLSYYW